MDKIIIPDDLILENTQPIQVYKYMSYQEKTRQQIVFKLNTLSFLIEGTKTVLFEDSKLSSVHSKFFIMKSGNCLMTEKLSNKGKYQSILLFFSNESIVKFLGKFKTIKNSQIKHKSVYSFEYDEYILRFANSLSDISKLSKRIQQKLLEVKFEEIMYYLTEIYGIQFLQSLLIDTNDTQQKFVKTIENNKLNKLTVSELAFLCNMSISTFKRKFKQHYFESPIQWFQNKRLEHAYYLLTEEQKNASEIYLEIGYENLSSFIQAYKLKYGVTPKQQYKI